MVYFGFIAPDRRFLRRQFESERLVSRYLAEADVNANGHWKVLRDAGLWEFLSPDELKIAETPPTRLTSSQSTFMQWRAEATLPLMWALQQMPDLPLPDREASKEQVMMSFDKEIDEFIESAQSRAVLELEQKRAVYGLWYHRGQLRELQESGRWTKEDAQELNLRTGGTLEDQYRAAIRNAWKAGAVSGLIDGDLSVRGLAYAKLPDSEWAEVMSRTHERLFALNWICGFAPKNEWDDTPLEV